MFKVFFLPHETTPLEVTTKNPLEDPQDCRFSAVEPSNKVTGGGTSCKSSHVTPILVGRKVRVFPGPKMAKTFRFKDLFHELPRWMDGREKFGLWTFGKCWKKCGVSKTTYRMVVCETIHNFPNTWLSYC